MTPRTRPRPDPVAGPLGCRYAVIVPPDDTADLEAMAREQVRSPEQQILYSIREMLRRWRQARTPDGGDGEEAA